MNKRTTLNWLFGAFAMFLSGTAVAQTYCTTVGPSSTADTEIRDVYLLGDNYGISNPTTCPAVAGLRDFTQIDSADLSRGTSYSLEALMSTCGGVYGSFARAWIDYNDDGDFTDAGEELGTWSGSPAASGSTVRNAFMSFTVPLTATLGRTRIRVMLREGGTTTSTTSCATYSWGSVHDYTIRITNTPPACPIPGQLAVNGITATQASVTWTSTGTAFNIEYGPAGYTQGSGTSLTSTTASATITGLSANTCYDVYVRNNCSATNSGTSAWSGPLNFCTTCATLTLPTTETFGTFPPNCWSVNTGSVPWTSYTTGGVTLARANYWSNNDDSFILESAPIAISVPARVVIDWSHLANASYPFDSMTVRVRNVNSTVWTNILSRKGSAFNTPGAGTTTPASVMTHDIAYLPASFVGTTVVAQVYGWSDFGPDLFVDFITFEAQPACPEPLQLGVSSVTDVTANLNWQSGASGFVVQWGPAGFSIGTGASDTVATNSAVATGLAPNSPYDFYVMALCGGAGNSIWSGPFSFNTLCAGFTLPTGYSANFDQYVATNQPDCWYKSGSATFAIPTFPGTTAYTAPNYAQASMGGTAGSTIISPMFTDLGSGGAQVRFRANKISTWSTTNVIVGLVSTPSNPGSFVAIDTIALTTAWAEYTIPFPVVPSGYKHVGFRTTSTFATFGIDDFTYEAQPACLPVINGSASAAATSAVVAWVHGVAATPGSVVAWGPSGFNPGTGVIPNQATVNGTSFTISGLAPNTPYTVWIADSCGANNLAPWFGPINFTTSCLGTTMPYVENFDVSPLGCWNNQGGTQTMLQYAIGAGYAMRGNFWSWTSGNNAVMSSRPVAITAPAQATFDWSHQYMTFYPNDQLILLGKTTTASTWDTLVNLIGPSFSSPGAGTMVPGTFVDTTVFLPTSWIGSNAIFRFVANSGFGPDVFFDNFVVEAIPTCPEPIASVVAGSVSTTSAGISWSAPSGTPLGSNVFWGPVGFWQGTGTGLGGTMASGVTSPYTITGLIPGQSYHFYVQDSCSATDQSTWAGPYTITTALCPPANQCTSTMYMYDSWGDGWNGGVITAQQKISGSWVSVKSFTFMTGSAAQDVVQFCAGDSVRIVVTSGGSFANEIGFDLVGPFGDTLSTMPFNSTLIAGSTWNSFVAQCTPCPVPVGVNATGSTTCTSTTVTWTSASSAVSTNLEYGPAGFTPGSGTTLTGLTGGTTNLTGLTPNTAYDVYVQAVCATGTSPWSSAAMVTTLNAPQPTLTSSYTVLSMNPVTIQFNATTNASSVSWSFSNGGSATGTSTVQSFGTNGPAFAVATVNNGCGTVSDTLNFTVGMGENALATLRVFPNPTTGLVRVEFPMQTSGTATVRVLSITGAQLTAANAQFAAGTASVDLDLRGLASGLYLLEVQTEEATGVQRLVIER